MDFGPLKNCKKSKFQKSPRYNFVSPQNVSPDQSSALTELLVPRFVVFYVKFDQFFYKVHFLLYFVKKLKILARTPPIPLRKNLTYKCKIGRYEEFTPLYFPDCLWFCLSLKIIDTTVMGNSISPLHERVNKSPPSDLEYQNMANNRCFLWLQPMTRLVVKSCKHSLLQLSKPMLNKIWLKIKEKKLKIPCIIQMAWGSLWNLVERGS